MSAPDIFRAITLFLTLIASVRIIPALWERVPTNRAWLIIGVLEIQFIGATVAIVDAWGGPLVWWRTPRILIADVLALIYVELVYLDHRRALQSKR